MYGRVEPTIHRWRPDIFSQNPPLRSNFCTGGFSKRFTAGDQIFFLKTRPYDLTFVRAGLAKDLPLATRYFFSKPAPTITD
ncbi:hypothetical protein [Chroococcidiopsis sp. SAG 2025]|uniref:hypothetical protein n=1 Tax=Chroococcidiopsis sp. SAG 2025 TaxID=171389 RepID=UPI0029372A6F|nr:hypothetical protein [Chroococcidiopsis sp. SAG 2025]